MKPTLFLLLMIVAQAASGQGALSLEACYERAGANYPLLRNRGLISKAKSYSIENAAKGYLPQVTIGGQATYQSEVTQIPLEMPGIEPLNKDQYRISGEISQTVYHGGMVGRRKEVEESKAEIEEQELEVELYTVKSRINDLFFGILLMQEQLLQTQLVKQDLLSGIRKVEASIANGTAIQSSADALRAELLRVEQRDIEMESMADSYRQMLGMFINESITAERVLEKPVFGELPRGLGRPELKLFETQKKGLVGGEDLLIAARKPRLELFVQAGYGRPGLNMLENEFNFYYLGGVRFSWQLSGYYTLRKEREIYHLRRQTLDNREETFRFNTGLLQEQHQAEIIRLKKLVGIDEEILSLRTKVRQIASVQLEEGVITSTDFVREVNAEDQARQFRALHETQLLHAQAKYHFTTGY